MVHLQLALLVDHDYYLNVFLFEQKNLVDRDVVLKRKVHWLYTLVDPSKYVLDCSSGKYSTKLFSLSLQSSGISYLPVLIALRALEEFKHFGVVHCLGHLRPERKGLVVGFSNTRPNDSGHFFLPSVVKPVEKPKPQIADELSCSVRCW